MVELVRSMALYVAFLCALTGLLGLAAPGVLMMMRGEGDRELGPWIMSQPYDLRTRLIAILKSSVAILGLGLLLLFIG